MVEDGGGDRAWTMMSMCWRPLKVQGSQEWEVDGLGAGGPSITTFGRGRSRVQEF